MKTIDVLGKPCPIPVIEAKKALEQQGIDGVLVKVDNIVAVQNLEKMAKGQGYDFAYTEHAGDRFDVEIGQGENKQGDAKQADGSSAIIKADGPPPGAAARGATVVIGRNTMGSGEEELGKVLIKGFIYALSELRDVPEFVIFLNSGAHLTSDGANTIEDLIKLESKGTKIFTCGTCVNYYGLKTPAVGTITDMYGIAEKMAAAPNVINI